MDDTGRGENDMKQCFSNLRFADDVMLMPNSLNQPTRIITDFKRNVERYRFKINLDETEILINQNSREQKEIEVHRMKIEVPSPEGNVKYMEQLTTFRDKEFAGVDHRIRCVRAAFAKHPVKN